MTNVHFLWGLCTEISFNACPSKSPYSAIGRVTENIGRCLQLATDVEGLNPNTFLMLAKDFNTAITLTQDWKKGKPLISWNLLT